MDFTLPTEYDDFVSSAQELLDNFDRMKARKDFIAYAIYPIPVKQIEAGDDDIRRLKAECCAFIESISKNYIWNEGEMNLQTFDVLNDADPSIQCVSGSTSFGDNIEDEWFIVYILFELSKKFPDVAIRTIDSDGQFLLVEAAAEIPDWIDPDNSVNRVWIKNGVLHIIPLDEPGKMLNGISLKSALNSLQSTPKVSIASLHVQNAIQSRMAEYPGK